MRILLVVILFILTAPAYSSAAGPRVGNGGGIAESNVAFARINFYQIIENCLTSRICLYDEKSITLARKIQQIIPAELTNDAQIIVRTQDSYPDLFIINGQVKIAVTGDNIGDPIYFNRDLMYYNVNGKTEAISITQAFAILFHEYSHHIGYIHTPEDDKMDFIDTVAAKIANYAGNKIIQLATMFWHDPNEHKTYEYLQTFIVRINDVIDKLLLHDIDNVYDLTPIITPNLRNSKGEEITELDYLSFTQAVFKATASAQGTMITLKVRLFYSDLHETNQHRYQQVIPVDIIFNLYFNKVDKMWFSQNKIEKITLSSISTPTNEW